MEPWLFLFRVHMHAFVLSLVYRTTKSVSIPKKQILSRKISSNYAILWPLFRKQSFAFYFTDKIQEKMIDKICTLRYDVLNAKACTCTQ